ncbi:MAG: Maf family protein [Bacteroidia bacterium]
MKKTTVPLILGSQSPRRKQLLAELRLPFEIIVRPTEETVAENLSPAEVVQQIATEKAAAFADLAAHSLIITADTIVVQGNTILGKPKDAEDAFAMLTALSGTLHEVMTAVCLYHQGKMTSFVETTKVFFRAFTPEEIRDYIATYQPFDKAGSYGVQEWAGMTGIHRLEGDFYNVMGLPVCRLYQALKEEGFLVEA